MSTTTDEQLADAYCAVLDDCSDPTEITYNKLVARHDQLVKPREHKVIEFLAAHPELTKGAYSISIWVSSIRLQVDKANFVPPAEAKPNPDNAGSYDEYVAAIDDYNLVWVLA